MYHNRRITKKLEQYIPAAKIFEKFSLFLLLFKIKSLKGEIKDLTRELTVFIEDTIE